LQKLNKVEHLSFSR